MPGFHHSDAVSPFFHCKVPLFRKNYVRKLRSVTAVNSKKIRNDNGVRKRQRLTGKAKRQRTNGNGMVETEHHSSQAWRLKRVSRLFITRTSHAEHSANPVMK